MEIELNIPFIKTLQPSPLQKGREDLFSQFQSLQQEKKSIKPANKLLKRKQLPYIPKGLGFVILVFMSFFFIPSKIFAENVEPDYTMESDEVLVFLYVKNLGTCEIPIAIRGQDAYLPIVDVFNFLKIRSIPGNGFDVVSGFFIDPNYTYQIDRVNNLIIYRGKTYSLSPNDFIVTETNLYLKAKYFEQIFGLEAKFNFRTLTISLKSELELPAIREMRLEQMHSNFDRLRGHMKADTTIARTYPLLHFGAADWYINSNQQMNGKTNTRLNLGLGAIVAGGEFNSLLLYNANQPFLEKQQYYLWRYANNDNKIVRQVLAGKIATQSISSVFNPVIGLQITNARTLNRKSFGSYTLSNYTKPNWTVELYVNNILIDYVKADASGFFTFDVPLIYGSTDVTLRYYGPWGEELTSKQSFNIPFNFLPPKELEYKVSSGIIEDNKNSLLGQARVNYGLTRFVTIGGGLEYNSSITTTKRFSFFNTSIRLGSNMLFSGEFVDGVRYKGLLSYHMPSDLQLELYYSKYNPGQQVIKLNYTEERRMMISKPFKLLTIPGLSRFTLSQNLIQHPNTDLPPTKYTIPEFSLSGASHRISMNITTTAFIINKINSSIFSDVSLSTTLPGGVLFTPQIRFDYKLNKISIVKYSFEKSFKKYGVINASYQHNLINNLTLYQIGFRYDFSYARVGFTAFQSNNNTSLSEFASGSLIYQPQLNYTDINVNTNVGRGGLIFLPFLDINNDGKKNTNEPKVSGLNIMMSGGGIQKISKDTTIVISGLEPYTDCFVELDANNFENMAWRIKNPKMNIAIEPNKLKLIEIPISIVGEAAGTVYIKKKQEETGLGRILVCFYSQDSVLINKTLTESDGYFSFLGLLPGSYYAKIDREQMTKLQMTSSPSSIPFSIKSGIDGDVVDGLKFSLQSNVKVISNTIPEKQLVLKSDSLPDFVKNKAITEQQELKIVNPPQISDTLKMLLALMVKHKEDSIKFADSARAPKGITASENSDSLNRSLVTISKNQEDSTKLAIKQPEIMASPLTSSSDSLKLFALMEKKRIEETQIQKDPIQNETGNYEVQARAHTLLSDARIAQTKLSKKFKQQVIIVNEGGLYKVRITGINNRNEAVALIPELESQGFAGAFIIKPSQAKGIPVKAVESSIPKEQGKFAMQVRAYSKLSNAEEVKSKLNKIFSQPVIILNEGGLYKVRITGFNSRDEAEAIRPKLDQLGYTDAFIISPDKSTGSIKSSGKQPGDPSLDLLIGILKGENKSEKVLSPAELASVEEAVVNKTDVFKRSKFGDNPIYSIQIASHENGLPQNTLAVIVKLQTEVESNTNKNNGITKYFTGSYNSYNQAVKAKNELVKNGFIEPFIIVIHKGKIISVKEYNSQKK
ncbi:MAG: SPOR domain-containing protein [Bacteroidia bacterium]|nr:SPOR domain-containing protein [Bacteroidia bacterium]